MTSPISPRKKRFTGVAFAALIAASGPVLAAEPQARSAQKHAPDPQDAGPAAQGSPPTKAPPEKYTTMLLVDGSVKYGAITMASLSPDENDVINPDTSSAGSFGAQATLGIMPGGSAFTLAGRLHAGSYLRDGKGIPYMGAQMLFGASFMRREGGRSFSYALGGVGVEYLPSENQDLLTLNLGGGGVIREFNFGGGLDIGANAQFAVVMVGLHVGWGRLFF